MTVSNSDDRPRRLPARPRPKAGETTDSYVRRLAQANHLKPSYLRGYLAGPPEYGPRRRLRADRLAAITGRQQDVLERALTDLAPQKSEPAKPKRRVTRAADKPALFAAIRKDAADDRRLSVRQLSQRHNVSQRIVGQALASPTPPPRKQRVAVRNPARERTRSTIDTIIDGYAAAHGGQPPTVTQVWERLLDEHDITVGFATVHRYMSDYPFKNPSSLTSHPERTAGNFLAVTRQTFQSNVFKHYRALLAALQKDPVRHGLDDSFATNSAFILGLDAGTSWNMLTGFQEWLVVRLNRGHDLTWPVLVRHLTPSGWIHPLTPQADGEAIATLYRLLREYFDQREQPDGLSTIFKDYQSWLTTQAWYQFETVETDQIN